MRGHMKGGRPGRMGRSAPVLLAAVAVFLVGAPSPARAAELVPSPALTLAPQAEATSSEDFRVPGGSPERARFLRDLNERRIQLNWLAVWGLTGWTVANFAAGTVGYFATDDPTWRAFHQMNALFNIPILGTAIVSMFVLAAQDPNQLGLYDTLHRGVWLERLLLVGIGLDVVAVTFGMWMWERGLRKDSERLVGYGRSFILQGTVLFLFDTSVFLLNADYDAKVMMLLSPETKNPAGLALRVRF